MRKDTLLLDVGGVMLYPMSGDWMLSGDYAAVLGADFEARREEFRRVRRAYGHLLPDGYLQADESEEVALLQRYYDAVLNEGMHMHLSAATVCAMAHLQADTDSRYGMFDDVLPYLQRWSERYHVGIVSDAPPSMRRIIRKLGIEAYVHAPTYSFQVGILKPKAGIFRHALAKAGRTAQQAVFVDDMTNKLIGAHALGIDTVQMNRAMPDGFVRSGPWPGRQVRDFAQLDALLETILQPKED